jgi:phosphoheptose isomerase
MLREFVDDYANNISFFLQTIPEKTYRDAIGLIGYARRNNRVYVGGNGGSAAISNHLTCDFSKGCDMPEMEPLRTHSLSSNVPLMTAIANDISYEQVFSKQLEYMGLRDNDVVILISSSGNSKNIVVAAQYTNKIGAHLIGLTGFDGGKLKELSKVSFHIPKHNYGIVEDCHQAIMHILAQYMVKEIKAWF